MNYQLSLTLNMVYHHIKNRYSSKCFSHNINTLFIYIKYIWISQYKLKLLRVVDFSDVGKLVLLVSCYTILFQLRYHRHRSTLGKWLNRPYTNSTLFIKKPSEILRTSCIRSYKLVIVRWDRITPSTILLRFTQNVYTSLRNQASNRLLIVLVAWNRYRRLP